MRLKDKVAVVTGGAGGIGRETARKFLENGAKVAICDINRENIDNTVDSLKEIGDITGFKADVTKRQEIKEMLAEVNKQYSRIDILVNNAGITDDARLVNMTDQQFDRVIGINLKGVFNCTKEVVPYMLEQGSGKIINTSSVVGIYGNFGQTNYVASKSAIIGMTKTWAKEFGKKGINVNAVAPGFIITEMTGKVPEKILAMMKEKTPLGRLGLPEDVANVYLFLASHESNYVHGTVISVDGGIVI